MAEKIFQPLYDIVKNEMRNESTVWAEDFAFKIKDVNNTILWKTKLEILPDSFEKILKDDVPINLEVYAESFRCLAQIYLNLLMSFDSFKECTVRKYSSAYDYIQKVEDCNRLLKEIGYENEKNRFVLKKDIESVLSDTNINMASKLLVCYQELIELAELFYPGCTVSHLTEMREDYLKISSKSDEEIEKELSVCDICDGNVPLYEDIEKTTTHRDPTCRGCGQKLCESHIGVKYKEFVKRKFNVDAQVKPEEDNPDDRVQPGSKTEPKHQEALVVTPVIQNEPNIVLKAGQWSCKTCTFVNNQGDANCKTCGGH